ncbi:recombinase RecA [Nonomuraea roseoviolacea subsp. roseoviolacea]|uniref:hypothetical protein n=1 Tax=Nonomuraea roseoviolacea TaxID=103837 RepID=UPI0031DC37CC
MTLSKDALALIAEINKKHGEGAVMAGSDLVLPSRFTTGSLGIDVILGGGWPANQWVEVIGKESQGKTAIVLKTIAANQKLNPDFTTLWIASEHFDTDQAEALGVDLSRVVVVPTQDMEFAFETILMFAESRTVDCIVLDSYPALIPGEEADKTMEDAVVAVGARLTGKFFRKAGSAMKRGPEERPILGIFINQFRDQIGGFSPHGNPQTTPGGNAKNYAFYTRVQVKRDEYIDEARKGKGKTRVGQVIKVETIKHKAGPPRQVATVRFFFRDAPVLGFSRGDYDTVEEIMTYGVLYNVIRRGGAYYKYGDNKWGPGREKLLDELRANEALVAEIREKVLEISAQPDHVTFAESNDE